MIFDQKTGSGPVGITVGAGDRDPNLVAALAERLGDPLSRGRLAATELRSGPYRRVAELLDELCDDLERVSRQFVRLGFDLHDEALQDLAALRNDLGLFQNQVSMAFESPDMRSKVVGRVDDFLARVVDLDRVLRGVMTNTETSPVLRHAVSVTLESVVDAYPGPCKVESLLDPEIDRCGLTDSQRIALVRIVQSALANVAQHSGAAWARVAVNCGPQSVVVEILDDGAGFDVEESLRRAVEEQRFGLVGMAERVRLLGGVFSITSEPGGPTRVFFELPHPTS
jgi:signal transduction histidine kinase